MSGSYWSDTGKNQKAWEILDNALVPPAGEASTKVGQAILAAAMLNYDLFNNGGGNAFDKGEFRGRYKAFYELLTEIVPANIMVRVWKCFIRGNPPKGWENGCCMDEMVDCVFDWALKELARSYVEVAASRE